MDIREAAARVVADRATEIGIRCDNLARLKRTPKRRISALREAVNALLNAERDILALPIPPPSPDEHSVQMLGEMLGRVLVHVGLVRADAPMTGPELLCAAETFLEAPVPSPDVRNNALEKAAEAFRDEERRCIHRSAGALGKESSADSEWQLDRATRNRELAELMEAALVNMETDNG